MAKFECVSVFFQTFRTLQKGLDVFWANFWLCAVYFESVSRLPGCGEEAGTEP